MRTTVLVSFLTCTSLSAQCGNAWQSTGTVPGVDGTVSAATMWDPDGPGPATPRVAVGGGFTSAGGVAASNVAAWDPATGTWSALGSGIGGGTFAYVSSVVAMPNGDLVVGGNFTVANGAVADLVARWNGTSWAPMGSPGPTGGAIAAMKLLPNGDIVAAGTFTTVGTTTVNRIARWNGSAWLPLGSGLSAPAYALTVLTNGDVVAGGEFTTAGGIVAPHVAQWNGTAWSAMGPAQANANSVNALATMPNGDVVAAGVFASLGGVTAFGIARWNGTAWSPLGGTINDTLGAGSLLALPNGDVILGGYVSVIGGVQISGIARWNGTAWSPLSSGVGGWNGGATGAVFALVRLSNGDVIAGGRFELAGGVPASRIARWNGTAWSSIATGSGPGDTVNALQEMPDGSVVAGGRFTAAGGFVANHVARWDNGTWSALGTGFPLQVDALLLEPSGGLVAGGYGFVKRWNGTAWTSVGPAFDTEVRALARLPNGDLVAGGDFLHIGGVWITNLARWNGTAWITVGGGPGGAVQSLAVLGNGDLVVGGWLNPPGAPTAHGIARWDGTAWSTFGSGLEGTSLAAAYAIEPLPSGGFVAGGLFTTAGGVSASNVAIWNGAAWSPLGSGMNGPVLSLHRLPNGDLLAGGLFTQAGGVAANRIARWNGTAWSAVGAGLVLTPYSTNTPFNGVRAFATAGNGDVLVGGGIFAAGGLPSANLARLTTTCPATAQSQGAGCAGDTVTATLPWTGSTWRADASGLPTAAMVFVVNGFGTASLPLVSVFATALPGCTLHVQPDFVDIVLASQGIASVQFALPNTPSLAGVIFHHQMIPLALDATLAVTATNSLQLTVGSY